MKRAVIFSFILGMAAIAGSVQVRAADDQVVGPLRTQWEATRKLVTGIAEAVPEAKYDFKPTPEVRSFREQLVHLVGENHMFMGMVAGDKPMDRKALDALKSREEILKALSDSYDYGTKVLANLTDATAVESVPAFGGRQTPRWAIAMSNMLDNMDHYGNLVVYVRLNGITPPRSAK